MRHELPDRGKDAVAGAATMVRERLELIAEDEEPRPYILFAGVAGL